MQPARLFAALGLSVFGTVSLAAPVEYQGITFPQGEISFADAVISYDNTLGGAPPSDPIALNPADAVGPPDYSTSTAVGSVSLGRAGWIILQFTDNRLTGSGDSTPDLHIFEVGAQVEAMTVEISRNGVDFLSVGSVGGATSSIDIDAFGFGADDTFAFVRLTDVANDGSQAGPNVGADIDAVGAISSIAAPPPAIPLPAAVWSGLSLLASLGSFRALRRH